MWQPGLTPAGLCVTPEWGKEGCCHGGLCEANSSRVKWEIFIPRVRLRAGQRLRAGELGYYTDTVRPWCAGRWALRSWLDHPSSFTPHRVCLCVCLSGWLGQAILFFP